MYLQQFLDNPIGKGDASIPNKSLLMGALAAKYEKYIDASTGRKNRIEMKVYRNGASDVYYFWLTMPTETERDNSYDVVFKFFDVEKKHKRDLSIAKFDFQVFANTPSFAYTFAYVYNKEKLLIPELSNKLGRRFYSDSPDVRNRNQNLMYDKYIYMAARYILESKKMNRVVLEAIAKNYDKKYLASHIRTLDTIMDEYRRAEDKLKKKKRTKENHGSKIPRIQSKRTSTNPMGHMVEPVRRIDSTVSKSAHRKTSIAKKHGTIKKK